MPQTFVINNVSCDVIALRRKPDPDNSERLYVSIAPVAMDSNQIMKRMYSAITNKNPVGSYDLQVVSGGSVMYTPNDGFLVIVGPQLGIDTLRRSLAGSRDVEVINFVGVSIVAVAKDPDSSAKTDVGFFRMNLSCGSIEGIYIQFNLNLPKEFVDEYINNIPHTPTVPIESTPSSSSLEPTNNVSSQDPEPKRQKQEEQEKPKKVMNIVSLNTNLNQEDIESNIKRFGLDKIFEHLDPVYVNKLKTLLKCYYDKLSKKYSGRTYGTYMGFLLCYSLFIIKPFFYVKFIKSIPSYKLGIVLEQAIVKLDDVYRSLTNCSTLNQTSSIISMCVKGHLVRSICEELLTVDIEYLYLFVDDSGNLHQYDLRKKVAQVVPAHDVRLRKLFRGDSSDTSLYNNALYITSFKQLLNLLKFSIDRDSELVVLLDLKVTFATLPPDQTV